MQWKLMDEMESGENGDEVAVNEVGAKQAGHNVLQDRARLFLV
jgi:hypothetical protein